MATWYVKDLSKLTGVSVQTLHHYDRIKLLIPSQKLSNGYRVYSESDLLKLQQIIALKYFGFSLQQIKKLLSTETEVVQHLWAQAEFLANKANEYTAASESLKNILAMSGENKSIPWETIIQLIEVYRMQQQLEHAWIGSVLNTAELQQYMKFQTGLKERFTPQQKQGFEQEWLDLIAEIETNLKKEPTSEYGKILGKRCMELVNALYGEEHANLKYAIWEKGYKGETKVKWFN